MRVPAVVKKVYVLAGYQHFAACYLIYHVGRVLEEHFGYEPVVIRVDNETPENSPFDYPRRYPVIGLHELAAVVQPQDILLPLAAASDLGFGLNLRCRKLLYVQGANTFKVMDGFMDAYVSVSSFVRQHLVHLYGIDTPVIPPFVAIDRMPQPAAWEQRDPRGVVVFAKPPAIADGLIGAFAGSLSARHPDVQPHFQVVQRGVPHAELMNVLARTRYLVALSPTEGFGLLPLEAMALGCAVVGFHGGGGLDYMTDRNSRNVGYPRLDTLVDLFANVFRDGILAESLAAQGREDARRFTLAHFEASWVQFLRGFGA